MYYKGVNLLPTIKEKQIKQYSTFNKKLLKYSLWVLFIILINLLSYIPVSIQKVRLANLQKEKKELLITINNQKEKYIKYHNLAFRVNLLENIKRSRFYLSQLVRVVDNTTYPSVATQYTIGKNGHVIIGLKTDSFIKASVSWHKLLTKRELFKSLNLSSFSNQKGTIPFILKGQVNIKFIQSSSND